MSSSEGTTQGEQGTTPGESMSEHQLQFMLKELQVKLEEPVATAVEEMTRQLMQIKSTCLSNAERIISDRLVPNNSSHKRCSKQPGKVFYRRNSLLTDLFQIDHIRTIYHIFIAMLALLFLQSIISDWVESGRVNIGLDLIVYSFGNLSETLQLWLAMFASVVLLFYPSFYLWSHRRHTQPVVWDMTVLAMFVVYLSLLVSLPPMYIIEHQVPPASSMALIMEQVRLVMKVYAFVRSNVARVRKTESSELRCPSFRQFIFFLFVPTLVYRDCYPRTSKIKWSRVVVHLLQLAGCVFYANFLMERFILVPFRQMNTRPLTAKQLGLHLFSIIGPAMFCYLSAFFGLLHAWLNAFAEITRFADRLFYRDWWNSTNFANFYRTWNIVVHDWLYEYIYLDMIRFGGKRTATLAVFAVSSIVHEYVLMIVFRFFFPLLFLQFGVFGTWIYFLDVRNAAGNVMVWMCLSLGVAMDFCFYAAEWYSRVHCPSVHEDVFLNFLSSRAWSCTLTNSSSETYI